MASDKKHSEAKKKDGTLKKEYKDLPRYRAIFGYEKEFTDNFEKQYKSMSKEIVKEIATLAGVRKNK